MEASDLTLSEELIHRFDSGGISEMFQQSHHFMDDQEDHENEPDDVIILHMDIREPLRNLQKLVEQKICVDLKGFNFWLQDAQELEPHKNLVDQCVKGEGLVQINVQIQTINQRINIVDVLKPTEAALAALAAEEELKNAETTDDDHDMHEESSQDSECERAKKPADTKTGLAATSNSKDKPCLNWVLDSKFKKEQARLKIPDEPNDWTVPQVKHWFQWAVRQFDLTDITLADWAITGKELCSLSHEEFRKKLPTDPGNVFWTHLQLLKECKFVSVVHKAAESVMKAEASNSGGRNSSSGTANVAYNVIMNDTMEHKILRKPAFHKMKNFSTTMPSDGSPTHIGIGGVIVALSATLPAVGSNGGSSAGGASAYGVGSGNNGQVQLWQFLLEILTDREHVDIIQWVGTDGEFKLTDPERVARLWGEKKNKPAMNYEKLSRALRYYYDGDMISKVSGKRFAYKFDCDLKLLIGYDAAELSKLVNEKSFMDESVYLDHMYGQSDDE